jgi:hypothetical protein
MELFSSILVSSYDFLRVPTCKLTRPRQASRPRSNFAGKVLTGKYHNEVGADGKNSKPLKDFGMQAEKFEDPIALWPRRIM